MPQFNEGDPQVLAGYHNTHVNYLESTTDFDDGLVPGSAAALRPRSPLPELGHIAYYLASDILVGQDHPRALYEVLVLEDRLQVADYYDPLALKDRGVIREFYDHISDFHAALPFGEQERARLLSFARYTAAGNRSASEPPQVLYRNIAFKLPATVVLSEGQPHSSSGPDLLSRWGRWHLQIDEFAGTSSVRQTRKAVGEIAHMCLRRSNLREQSNYDLNGLRQTIDETSP